LTLRAGTPVRLTFVRTTDKTCATEVVFPSLNIRRPLPLNQPVAVEFTPKVSGEIGFVCGMNMLRGTVVIQ
jgi:plastocyanin domain-containing protein